MERNVWANVHRQIKCKRKKLCSQDASWGKKKTTIKSWKKVNKQSRPTTRTARPSSRPSLVKLSEHSLYIFNWWKSSNKPINTKQSTTEKAINIPQKYILRQKTYISSLLSSGFQRTDAVSNKGAASMEVARTVLIWKPARVAWRVSKSSFARGLIINQSINSPLYFL